MKTIFPLVIAVVLCALASCNTVLRSNMQKVNVFSNAPEAKVVINDSLYTLPAEVLLKRDKLPVKITYYSYNKQMDSIVEPKIGPVFYLLNIPTIPAFGAGYWIDLSNKKRFGYPKNIFFNTKDSLEVYEFKAERYIAKNQITDETEQEAIRLKIKTHYLASEEKRHKNEAKEYKRYNPSAGTFRFYIAPPTLFLIGLSKENPNLDSFKNSVGGVSFGLGGDYYYKSNRFVSMELSHKRNRFDPGIFGSYGLTAHKLDASVRKGHRWNRFELSYGLSLTYTDYSYEIYKAPYGDIRPYMSEDDGEYIQSNYRTLGFSTVFNYQLTSVMFVGIRYNPAVYSFRIGRNGWDYEHIIGIDYRLKF